MPENVKFLGLFSSEKLKDLTDAAALSEGKRLIKIALARRSDLARWFGIDESLPLECDENSAFLMGILALFRYARGQEVPPTLVRSFLDQFLVMMFTGLARGAMALPPFHRMGDRPWAHAWRAAEIRLAVEEDEALEISEFAHLMGMSVSELEDLITANGFANDGSVPKALIEAMLKLAQESV